MSFPIIDVWANPVLPLDEGVPEVRRLFEQSHADTTLLLKRRTPDELVALMDAAGVSKICLCAWYRPGQAVFTNEDVAQFTRSHPDRFLGIAGVNLLDPVGYVQEIDKYVKVEGFKGVRVVPWLWNLPPTDKHYWPLYVKCIELDIPFGLSSPRSGIPDHFAPVKLADPFPYYIDEIALSFPSLSIICGHIGFPWTNEMIGVAWKHPNVYIDTSAYLPKYYPAELIQFANTVGRKKVMFGTNFPQLDWIKCIASANRDIRFREDVKADFFGGNAARVLKINTTAYGKGKL